MNESCIAVIPARGGSRRLKRKNILEVFGRPMLAWVVDACRESGCIDEVYVSSEDEEILEMELLSGREVLLLAKKVGRTSLIAWYGDDTTEAFLFNVVEDLSVLKGALRDIHPGIRVEMAPDRAALVLRGSVPTVKYKVAAEQAAREYLGSGTSSWPLADSGLLVQDTSGGKSAAKRRLNDEKT